jgi:hypothetical protein
VVKPRVFYLGGSRTQEVDCDWYERRRFGEPIQEDSSVEVAPGVRVQALGWGGGLLPDGTAVSGVWIAVWGGET